MFDWLRQQNLGFCCGDEPQLPNLLPPMAKATIKAEKTFIFDNNHWHGQAVSTTRQLQEMLD